MANKIRSEYEIGLKDDTSSTLARITTNVGKLAGVFSGLSALGGVAALGGIAASVRSTATLADELSKTSARVGVTVERLSELNYAASLSDVSTEGLNSALKKLNRSMSDAAQGISLPKAAFDALGVSVKNADGTLRGTSDVFSDIAKQFATLPDGATKTALAMQLFGRAGADLIPLLNSNADGFKAVSAEAREFGVVLSGELGTKAEALNDNLTRLETAGRGFAITIGSDIIPGLANLTTEFVKNYKEGSGLLRVFDALGKSIVELNRGSDQERLGGLLAEEIGLEKRIRDLQKAFDDGDTGKLVYIVRMKQLKAELASVRAEAEGLKAVLPPSASGAAPRPGPDAPAGPTDAEKKANEARARALLDGVAAAKKRQVEAEKLQKQQDDYLAKLREQLQLEGDSTELAKVKAEIQSGTAAKFDDATKAEALALADQLDVLKGTADVHEALLGYVRERTQLEEKATQDLAAHRQAVVESLQTPLENYTEAVKELLTLELKPDQLARGIQAARIEMTDAQNKALGLSDAARDLGLTFTSAFEDAVVSGKKFSDVLKGIASDIARILVRKSVTEPLGNLLSPTDGSPGLLAQLGGSLGSVFKGLFGGGKAGGGNVARGKYYMVGENGPELFAPGQSGAIVPNGAGGGVVVNVRNYGPVQDIKARSDGRTVDLIIGASLMNNIQSGRAASAGLRPALAGR